MQRSPLLGGAGVREKYRFGRPSGLCALLVAALLVAPPAEGASLPITSWSLWGFVFVGGTGAPVVLSSDSFQRADSALAGYVLPSGAQWVNPGGAGNWQVSANKVRSTTATSVSDVVVGVSRLDAAPEVTLSALANGANAGLSLNDDGLNSYAVYYQRSGGSSSVRLCSVVSDGVITTIVTLASASVGGTPTTVKLRATSVGSTFKVAVDGVEVINTTLFGADLAVKTTGGNNTMFGLRSDSDTTTVFDDFHVDAT